MTAGLPDGCVYNGPFCSPDGEVFIWFTEALTESSFLVPAREATPERIAAEVVCIRARFRDGQYDEPITEPGWLLGDKQVLTVILSGRNHGGLR